MKKFSFFTMFFNVKQSMINPVGFFIHDSSLDSKSSFSYE